jgi:hypothetical protein
MGKNRRRMRFKHPLAYVPKPVGIGFVAVVSLALVYLWMGHKCSQYSEEIKRLDDQYAELENERVREDTKWNGMKTAEQLDLLLVRNGLLMVYPNASQIVRVSGASRTTSGASTVSQAMPTGAALESAARSGATRVAGGRTAR